MSEPPAGVWPEGSPPLAEVEARMRPGAFTPAGWLGPDESLVTVLAQDAATLSGSNRSAAGVGRRLAALVEACLVVPGGRLRSGPVALEATTRKGFSMCPWSPDPHRSQCRVGEGVTLGSVRWALSREDHRVMGGDGVTIHLIRDHGFFGGPGSTVRVKPCALVALIEVLEAAAL